MSNDFQDEEYKFSDTTETISSYDTSKKDTSTKKNFFANKNMKQIIGVIILLVMISIYIGDRYIHQQKINLSNNVEIDKKTMLSQQNNMQVNSVLQSQNPEVLKDYVKKNESIILNAKINEKIKELDELIQNLNAKISNLDERILDLDYSNNKITGQLSEQNKKIDIYLHKKQLSNAKIFVTAAIIGRAWLKLENGTTITVREGDEIQGFGIVKKIDPSAGQVLLDDGMKITFDPKG